MRLRSDWQLRFMSDLRTELSVLNSGEAADIPVWWPYPKKLVPRRAPARNSTLDKQKWTLMPDNRTIMCLTMLPFRRGLYSHECSN